MELRLQQFIDSIEQLADIRNLDNFNPIIFQMEKPLTSTRFTVAGSKVEPSYLGVPVNTTWVVLEPTSPYYRKALKLRDVVLPDQATDLPPVGDVGLTWHIVRTYDEIFEDAQYYVGQTGPKGEPGPVGPTGPQGEGGNGGSGDPISIMAAFKVNAGSLVIKGPSSVSQGQTKPYELELTTVEADAQGVLQTVVKPVIAEIRAIGTIPANVAMQPGNNLVVGVLAANTSVRLHAAVLSWANMVEATLDVVLTKAQPVSLAITGAASIYAGDTSTYTAALTYDDNTTANVAVTWSVDDTATATVTANGGVLSGVNPIAADKNVTLTGTITVGGTAFTATKVVNVKKLTAVSLAVNGSASVNTGATATYTATVTLNSGRTQTVTPSWSVDNTALATISAGGVLSGVAAGAAVVSASYTLAGTTTPVTATKNVNVVAVSSPIYPYYGKGPKLPTDWQAFVTGLTGRSVAANITADEITITAGANEFMYYAYPKSYGRAQFMDKASPLGYGGMGGAGNNAEGSSSATNTAGYDVPIEANITVNGATQAFYIFRSDMSNLGAVTWQISKAA